MLTVTFVRRVAGLAFVAALAACSRNPQPATPTPQAAPAPPAAPAPRPVAAPAATPAPARPTAPVPAAAPAPAPAPAAPAAPRFDLAGDWDWTATFQGQPFSGTMSFQASGGSYSGVMRVAGQFDATLRTVTVTGNVVRGVLDSPQGEMEMEAQFTDANTLSGQINVMAAGEAASFAATRRR